MVDVFPFSKLPLYIVSMVFIIRLRKLILKLSLNFIFLIYDRIPCMVKHVTCNIEYLFAPE